LKYFGEVHIFDVDYTLIKSASSFWFLKECLRGGLIKLRQLKQLPVEYLRYKLGHANYDFIEDAVRHLGSIEKEKLTALSEICFERYIKPDLFRGAVDIINNLKKTGRTVILATSSFHTIIDPLQKYFDLDDVIASSLEFIDGKTTGRLSGKAFFGKNKMDAVCVTLAEHSVNTDDAWFYSDSYTDLPLLEKLGHPVAVNPDRFLRKIALKNNWQILDFKETLGRN
jgi:HAD superfamily hydrolase (TIGR01490 family)